MSDEPRLPRVPRKFGRLGRWWTGMTDWLRSKDGKISRIAVLAYIMLGAFLTLKITWDKWSFLAFIAPGALLVMNALVEKVPLSDMLDAMRAGSTAKIVEKLRGVIAAPAAVITETEGGKTTTTVPGRVGDGTDPVPPQGADASGVPSDGGVTE